MMGGKNAGFFHRYQQEIERMSGEAVEYVRGIPVVKMFPADGLLLQGLLPPPSRITATWPASTP